MSGPRSIGEIAMGPTAMEDTLEVELRYLRNHLRSHMQWLKEQIGTFGPRAGTWGAGSDHLATLALAKLQAAFPDVTP